MRTDEVKIILQVNEDHERVKCELKTSSQDPEQEEKFRSQKGYAADYTLNAIAAALAMISVQTGMDTAHILRGLGIGIEKTKDYLNLTGQIGRNYN